MCTPVPIPVASGAPAPSESCFPTGQVLHPLLPTSKGAPEPSWMLQMWHFFPGGWERVAKRTIQSVSHERRREHSSAHCHGCKSGLPHLAPAAAASKRKEERAGLGASWAAWSPGFSVIWHRAPEPTVIQIMITAANPYRGCTVCQTPRQGLSLTRRAPTWPAPFYR